MMAADPRLGPFVDSDALKVIGAGSELVPCSGCSGGYKPVRFSGYEP